MIEPFLKPRASLAGSLVLDRGSHLALHRQLADGLRTAILRENLPTGVRLPSTRSLASELGLSRNTVISAYEQLVSEGFLTSRTGDGTRVSKLNPHRFSLPARPVGHAANKELRKALSRTGALLETAAPPSVRCDNPAFVTGLPALEAFPHRLWARLVGRALRETPSTSLGFPSPGGFHPLKESIATHLKLTRGVRCEPDQVLILPGAQAALDIAARMLLNPGDEAWIEDPGYLGARSALKAGGARLRPIPVDEDGMDPSKAINQAKPQRTPALVYVTPSYQFPLGVTMTLTRRLALLDFARRFNVWILEDDYDSDFRYQGRPLAALQGLDVDGRVLYTGTFSKTMFPSLRMAYLVIPPALIRAFQTAVRSTGHEPPTFVQVALHEFIKNGYYRSHLRKMHNLYQTRQDAFIEAVATYLDDFLEVKSGDAGMQLVAFYRDGKQRPRIEEFALQAGVNVRCLSNYHLDTPTQPGLFLGYAAVPAERMPQAIRQLGKALENCPDVGNSFS